jgi:hypothetical protein
MIVAKIATIVTPLSWVISLPSPTITKANGARAIPAGGGRVLALATGLRKGKGATPRRKPSMGLPYAYA